MKKWFAGILILVAVFLGGSYLVIPSNLKITRISYINCTSGGGFRSLSAIENWRKWWPENPKGTPADTGRIFQYNNDTYQVGPLFRDAFKINIRHKSSRISSLFVIIPLSNDSMAVEWHTVLAMGVNPYKRLTRYLEADVIKSNMSAILDHMRQFLENSDNVYGIHISKISTKDTFLVATKSDFHSYPTTADIYRLVNNLKKYITLNNAVETDPPIMNITRNVDQDYTLMVAIPTNRELPGKDAIFYRRMVPGHFLELEVKGGNDAVNQAFKKMQNFISDHQQTVMAIPFESLVTDRSQEPDSLKWVTRIYQPAF